MAYTNKISAVVATAALFLAFTISPWCAEAQLPKLDPLCPVLISDIVKLCYFAGNVVPSDECCSSLKSANDAQVNCVCKNVISQPANNNVTQALFETVHTFCNVQEKYTCKGGDSSGGPMNKIAASVGLFGLVASLFF